MTSKTKPSAQSRLLSSNAPAAKTTRPKTPANSPANPAIPDAMPTCCNKAVAFLSALGFMLENNTIDRGLITSVLTSVAKMSGLSGQASNAIYAIIQLLPKALNLGLQLEAMASAIPEISKKANAAEQAAEESKLTVMSFVEQQGISRCSTDTCTSTTGTKSRTSGTQRHPDRKQDTKLPPKAIQRCKFRAATVYVQPSDQHHVRIEILDTRTLLGRAAATFELAWENVKDTEFVRLLELRASQNHTLNPSSVFQMERYFIN
ncbi:hypothetical protein RhiJN_23285 [Ceratobasidium sp. AG-Ba]|nr:hypothetical protein RhiJN_23285 [Ceratobasidium sp. AG-Ba]